MVDFAVPRTLWEMNAGGLGGDTAMQPTWSDALAQNRASLVGLGLGLASGGFQGAMQGYEGGARTDATNAYRTAQQRQHQQDLAFRQAEAKRQAGQWQQTFNRSGESPFSKVAQDLGLRPGTPEYAEAARMYHMPKVEGDVVTGVWEDPETEQKHPYTLNKRTRAVEWLQLPGVRPPGSAPAATAGPFTPRGQITGPTGEVYTPPAGLSKAGRKKFESDVAGTLADVATGKQTQEQSVASSYASAMELAERQMKDLEVHGLDVEGKAKERVPFGLGSYFQTNEYQDYRNARDAFVNAKLRRQSGATIRDDEFLREERVYFPQPGESEQQIRHKRALREDAVRQMKAAAGPGYKAPPETPPDTRAPGGDVPRAAAAAPPAAKKVINGVTYVKRADGWYKE